MTYTYIRRPWRIRKPYYAFIIPELLGITTMLVLFGLLKQNGYRQALWQVGSDNGFNSSPNIVLYAYANYKPLPTVPFVWSQALTDFLVAISVLSLFVMITKMIMLIMHVFFPILALFVSVCMAVLYAVGAYGQAGPDYADPAHPSPVAWYLRKSCSVAQADGAVQDCTMAKASFAVTIYMLALYLTNVGFAVYSLLPNKDLDKVINDDDSDSEVGSSPGGLPAANSKVWEMQPRALRTPKSPLRSPLASPGLKSPGFYAGSMGSAMSGAGGRGPAPVASPFTPGPAVAASGAAAAPFTPRTQAFHALDRKLPLRG